MKLFSAYFLHRNGDVHKKVLHDTFEYAKIYIDQHWEEECINPLFDKAVIEIIYEGTYGNE